MSVTYCKQLLRKSALHKQYLNIDKIGLLDTLNEIMCVCCNANPLHYYALWVLQKVDRWR